MNIQCQFCQTTFQTPEDKLPSVGTLVRCTHCRATFWVTPSSLPPESSPSSTRSAKPAPHPTTQPPHTLSSKPSASASFLPQTAPTQAPAPSAFPTGNSDSWWDLSEASATHKQAGRPAPAFQEDQSQWELPTTKLPSPAKAETTSPTQPKPSLPEPSSAPANATATTKAPTKAKPVLAGWEPSFTNASASKDVGDGPTQLTSLPFPSSESSGSSASANRPKRAELKLNAPTTPPPPSEDNTSPSVEFLLRDRQQQRQEFWATLTPLLLRSSLILGLLVFFVWLWTSRERNDFSSHSLHWQVLLDTWIRRPHTWTTQQIRYQWRPLEKGQLLVIRGMLHNQHHTAQPEPNLIIQSTHKQGIKTSKPLACCVSPSPAELHILRTSNPILAWNRQHLYRARKKLPPQSLNTFTLLWIPPPDLISFHILAVAHRTPSPTLRPKTPAPRPRPKDKDLDED